MNSVAPPRTTFPPQASASTWSTVVGGMFSLALTKRAKGIGPDGTTIVPRLTRGEALTLVFACHRAAGLLWPLWYQYAAALYGWEPGRRLNASQRLAGSLVPVPFMLDLWLALMALSDKLDDEKVPGKGVSGAPILFLEWAWSDPVVQGEVASALADDGADAQWLIPLPACKDPKTGKPTGKPHKDKDGKWTCDPVVIDDPVTAAKKSLTSLVLMVGALWWLFGTSTRRNRR